MARKPVYSDIQEVKLNWRIANILKENKERILTMILRHITLKRRLLSIINDNALIAAALQQIRPLSNDSEYSCAIRPAIL
jgi:hypothetical protein